MPKFCCVIILKRVYSVDGIRWVLNKKAVRTRAPPTLNYVRSMNLVRSVRRQCKGGRECASSSRAAARGGLSGQRRGLDRRLR
jgi:hypothetical protein